MSEEDVKQAYWRRMRRLSLSLTILAIAAGVILPLFAAGLNAHRILRFSLGTFLITHVSVVFLAILVYAFFGAQGRTDRDYNMNIQF